MQPVIASERQVFYRERAAGMYSVSSWYLGMVRGACAECRSVGWSSLTAVKVYSGMLSALVLGRHSLLQEPFIH